AAVHTVGSGAGAHTQDQRAVLPCGALAGAVGHQLRHVSACPVEDVVVEVIAAARNENVDDLLDGVGEIDPRGLLDHSLARGVAQHAGAVGHLDVHLGVGHGRCRLCLHDAVGHRLLRSSSSDEEPGCCSGARDAHEGQERGSGATSRVHHGTNHATGPWQPRAAERPPERRKNTSVSHSVHTNGARLKEKIMAPAASLGKWTPRAITVVTMSAMAPQPTTAIRPNPFHPTVERDRLGSRPRYVAMRQTATVTAIKVVCPLGKLISLGRLCGGCVRKSQSGRGLPTRAFGMKTSAHVLAIVNATIKGRRIRREIRPMITRPAISTNGRLQPRRAAYKASKNWPDVPVKVRFAAWVAARSKVESCRNHPIAAMRSMPAAASAVAGPSRGGGQIRRGGSCGSECAVGVEAFTGHHSPQSGRYSP